MENERKGGDRYDASTCFMVQYEMSVTNTGSKYIGCSNTWRFLVPAEDLDLENCAVFHLPISRPIRRTVIFSLEILEKNNDECILILVTYWKKTGLLHTKISKRNIIYSSQKPRKSSSLPLKSSSWLFSLDASLSSYKMSSSLPSSALLMPHFFKDFTIVSLLTRCQEFFTHSQTLEIEGHFTLPAGVT